MIWALHGAVGMAEDWRAFSSEIEGVRRLDLWRYLDCCSMSLEKAGAAIAREIARVDDAPILLGYSMGGRLALHCLLAQPKMWKGAVIVSAHPGLSGEEEQIARRQKDAEWSAMALKGEWEVFLDRWQAQGVLDGAVEMPDRLPLKSRRASVARSFVDWSLGAQKDLRGDLRKVDCPVLWITGEKDHKFTSLGAEVVEYFPQATHRVIPECGHRVPWEKPDDFQRSVRQFISAIS